ncbi:MAG: CsbD family protein [Undibacterium sp.]|uniref:CsbD family protein n=1 Tax=Undibacterium sp. TaxID=1914977 RepID=UPI002716CF45|nr:CsbD family protein [Undibacterium sp.]MDO8654118.1 CsbD family protein [Undibacterium sp.]
MNKDQIKGVTKDIAGKIQEDAGKLVGSKEQQAKGLLKQVEGKSEKALGDAKEVVKDAVNKL